MRRKRVLLIRARKAAGLTQEKAAYRLGVDRSTIARWESGETEPLPCLRPKLAKLLGITLTKLEELLLAVDTETDPSPAKGDPQSTAWRGTSLARLDGTAVMIESSVGVWIVFELGSWVSGGEVGSLGEFVEGGLVCAGCGA